MAASEQQEKIAGTAGTSAAQMADIGGRAGWTTGKEWLRHPEFWVAVALGGVLRLWALGSTLFLVDQATLMTLARDAVLRHALPVAGLASSIHTLNPPLSVYVLVPFALFDSNPLPAVVSLALFNVVGVALCYIFALRYFGRRVAAVGSLFFAAGPAAVLYSRFLWPQNYLPPLVALYAIAVYAGCIRGKGGMLVPAVTLLALGALLHPTALLLAPALLVGMLLAPRRPRWREYALSAAIVAVLLLPTIVWEVVSRWTDLRMLTTFSAGHATIDPEVFFRLYEALGAPGLPQTGSVPHAAPRSLAGVVQLLAAPSTNPLLGATSPYATLAPLYVVCGLVASLLFAVGWLALTVRVLAPAWRLWRDQPGQRAPLARLRWWAGALWRGLRADAAWRAYLLLWLLVTAPLALLIRHSSPIFAHYLIVLYPFAFLTMALGALALARGAGVLAGRLRGRARIRGRVAGVLLVALVAVLVGGQAAQSLLYTASLASGQFDARTAGYGYPLDALHQADARLRSLQRQAGATTVFIAESPLERIGMEYVLVSEHGDRIGFPDACLVLPPTDAGPALVVAASDSRDAHALASLPNATPLAEIPMAGNAPLLVYRVRGASGALPSGELPLVSVRLQDAASQGLQLESGSVDGGQIRLRWTVLRSTPSSAAPLVLRTQVRDVNAVGVTGQVRAFSDCAPTRWQAGDTLFTWLPFPPSWNGPPGGAPDTMLVQTLESTVTLAMPAFGPLRLLSSAEVSTPWHALAAHAPAGGQPARGGQVAPYGVLLREGDLRR